MTNKPDSFDRPRGLTNDDREFLTGGREGLSDNAERLKWYRIRERVRSVILDFSLLLEALPSDRLGQIFYPDDGDELSALSNGMVDALALFLLQQYEHPPEGSPPSEVNWNLNEVVDPMVRQNMFMREGLSRMLEQRDEALHDYENFEYSTTPHGLQNLMRRFRSGDQLTLDEFETLQRHATTADLRDEAWVVHHAAFKEKTSTSEDGDELIGAGQHSEWIDRSDDSTSEGTTDSDSDTS